MHAAASSALILALSLAACDRAGPPRRAPVEEQPAPAPDVAATAPDQPTPAPPAHPDDGGFRGEVLETMDSGGYTYVRLGTPAGEQWAAVNQAKVTVGETITIANATEMTDFESKTLGRTFPSILFGTLGAGAAAATPHAAPKDAPTVAQPIARAEGATGRTIAEVFAQKAQLAGQPVSIRGKVTKFNANILGKNWLHLQDGSGSAAGKDFDLTATSAATAQVGDLVTVTGVVRLDQDFGAGYAYDVIVEDATIAP